MALRAAAILDYQNVHLTARDVFNPRGGDHESLIHPILLARRTIDERNTRQRPGYPHAELATVIVYRGLPHVDHHWEQHRRCMDQATQWRNDGADVELRDLKYHYELAADRTAIRDVHGKKIPNGRPQEKGIDVLCALRCVREAARPDIDTVILASRDTDLVPVLDEIFDLRRREPTRYAQIETVSWLNTRAREEGAMSGGSLRRPPHLEHQPGPPLIRSVPRPPRLPLSGIGDRVVPTSKAATTVRPPTGSR